MVQIFSKCSRSQGPWSDDGCVLFQPGSSNALKGYAIQESMGKNLHPRQPSLTWASLATCHILEMVAKSWCRQPVGRVPCRSFRYQEQGRGALLLLTLVLGDGTAAGDKFHCILK